MLKRSLLAKHCARGAFLGRCLKLPRLITDTTASATFSTGKKTVPFILADIGEGIAEVELMQWFVAEGDTINQFDNVCEVQSDKATVEISSRYDGIVTKVHHEVGEMVQVGSALVDIQVVVEEEDEEVSAPPLADAAASSFPPADAVLTTNSPTDVATATPSKLKKEVLTTPAVRKLAKENGVDLALVVATGPKGRIIKTDVSSFVENARSPAADIATPVAAPVAPSAPLLAGASVLPLRGGGGVAQASNTVVPISGIQRIMVRSMNESLKIPHFTFSEEVVMDSLAELRGPLNALGAEHGVKLSYLPLVLKALSLTLETYPVLNSSLAEDESSLTYHGDHNIGVAMDTPRGLLVPNIKGVQHKSVFEIAAELQELQALGAAGKLGESHLSGGTITVSNMGSIGGTTLSPVVMAPQTAIVALGRIQTLPRFKENGLEQVVVPTKVMNVSWAGDHRVIDGATMAKFVNDWKRYLENPALMVAKLK